MEHAVEWKGWSGGLCALFWATGAWAQVCPGGDCLRPAIEVRGTVDFFATGGTFTFDDDADDRPDGLLPEGRVRVEATDIPPRAELERAFLYFGGSLYDDGDTRTQPDREVELASPGTDGVFRPVAQDVVFRSGPIGGFPEVTLYTVRADITDRLQDGPLFGDYRLRGFDADIFDGELEHTAANASFSLVLLFREPRLPPRNVVLFEGLQPVLGSTVTLDLSGFAVSRFPSGALTVYALEGDCNPGPDACARGDNRSGLEQIRVIGADPARQQVLSGPQNPPNDVFNRTINTVRPPLQNVVGTDIDTFDISSVLRPGDPSVQVRVTTPRPRDGFAGELVGLAYVVVGVDVFAPELMVDSRIQIENELGAEEAFFAGDPLRVTFAVSNTGNLAAEDVVLQARLPAEVTDFVIPPQTASVAVDRDTGQVSASGFSVRPGEVERVELRVRTACPLPNGGELTWTATVAAADLSEFTLTATAALKPRTRCGDRFAVFGGGGCRMDRPLNSGPPPWIFGWLLVAWLAWRCREPRVLWLLAWGLFGGCGPDGGPSDRGPPAPLGLACPERPGMVVIPSIRGQAPFCIDAYEARVISGALGAEDQPPGGDGSTTGLAVSQRFALPTAGVSWHQAAAACRNAGKRLCSAAEWQTACGGDGDRSYPYGDIFEPGRCNGFGASRRDRVETGAMIVASVGEDGTPVADGCVSQHGVYDLSGNLWEWNADPFFADTQRGLAGGSYRSNATGLTCLTEDRAAAPDDADVTHGFRCCADAF